MDKFNFDKINRNKTWKSVFDTIDDNFDKVKDYLTTLGSCVKVDKFNPTKSTALFNLSSEYNTSTNCVAVYLNGKRLWLGDGTSGFKETSSKSITLNTPAVSGDEVVVVYNQYYVPDLPIYTDTPLEYVRLRSLVKRASKDDIEYGDSLGYMKIGRQITLNLNFKTLFKYNSGTNIKDDIPRGTDILSGFPESTSPIRLLGTNDHNTESVEFLLDNGTLTCLSDLPRGVTYNISGSYVSKQIDAYAGSTLLSDYNTDYVKPELLHKDDRLVLYILKSNHRATVMGSVSGGLLDGVTGYINFGSKGSPLILPAPVGDIPVSSKLYAKNGNRFDEVTFILSSLGDISIRIRDIGLADKGVNYPDTCYFNFTYIYS